MALFVPPVLSLSLFIKPPFPSSSSFCCWLILLTYSTHLTECADFENFRKIKELDQLVLNLCKVSWPLILPPSPLLPWVVDIFCLCTQPILTECPYFGKFRKIKNWISWFWPCARSAAHFLVGGNKIALVNFGPFLYWQTSWITLEFLLTYQKKNKKC